MKKLLFGAFVLSTASIGNTFIKIENRNNTQFIITKPYNLIATDFVDAGTGWIWDVTDDFETYVSEIYSVNLKEYDTSYPTFFKNLIFEFDFTGSKAGDDVNGLINSSIFSLPYVSLRNNASNVHKTDKIGIVKSKTQADYIEATYYIIYVYYPNTELLEFYLRMETYAYNGGNGNVNTAGKGTSWLYFNNLKMKFDTRIA